MTEEPDDIPAEEGGSARRKRLSDAEVAAARELYELGKADIVDLARQFGVHRSTMSKKLHEIGAVKGSRVHEVSAAVKAEVTGFAAQQATWIEEVRMSGYPFLKNVRMVLQKMFTDRVKTGVLNFEIDGDNYKALEKVEKILVHNIEASLKLLKADEHIGEEDLPTLQLENLTQEDILEHFKNTGVLDENATVDDLNDEMLK